MQDELESTREKLTILQQRPSPQVLRRVFQKIRHIYCTPSNLIKYWPIFKLFFTVRIRRKFEIILLVTIVIKDPTAAQVCRYTIL